MRLRKKGQSNFPVTVLVIGIIGIVVLGIVFVAWKKGAIDFGIAFFKNLPDFVTGGKIVKSDAIFRYQVNEEWKYLMNKNKNDKVDDLNIVQFYYGVSWNNIAGGSYISGNNKFEYSTLLRNFRDYYFNTPRVPTDPLYINLNKDNQDFAETYLGEKLIQRFQIIILGNEIVPIDGSGIASSGSLVPPPGSVVLNIRKFTTNNPNGNAEYYPFYFVYTLDGRLFGSNLKKSWIILTKEDEMDTSRSPYKEIAEYARGWRDGFSVSTIKISYTDQKGNNLKTGDYPVKVINEDIVVDLSKSSK